MFFETFNLSTPGKCLSEKFNLSTPENVFWSSQSLQTREKLVWNFQSLNNWKVFLKNSISLHPGNFCLKFLISPHPGNFSHREKTISQRETLPPKAGKNFHLWVKFKRRVCGACAANAPRKKKRCYRLWLLGSSHIFIFGFIVVHVPSKM